MIKEYAVKKILDLAIDRMTIAIKNAKVKVLTSTDDHENAIVHHLREVKNWSSEISFADLRASKRTSDIYLPLDVYVQPRRHHLSEDETGITTPFENIFEDEQLRHIIIVGQPGAGKTTSVKSLCQKLMFTEEFLQQRYSFPLLLRLREINGRKKSADSTSDTSTDILIPWLQRILGLSIIYPDHLLLDENKDMRRAIRDRIVTGILDALNVLLILDGFDEIVHQNRRESILEDLRTLSNHLELSTFLLTSRTGEFNYQIQNTSQFEISPLKNQQIYDYATRWLGETAGPALYSEIMKSPFADTAIRPLTLAHLCAIYERIGRIPEKPKTVYKKVVNLLLEEWDEQRSISRQSMYAAFETDRKFEFLAHFAFVLTTSIKSSVFTKRTMKSAYMRICENFNLPATDSSKVINELESHTGLFIQSGYENFEFSHKSLQEYLSAEFIVKLPSIPKGEALSLLPNELAIAVAISSTPSSYFIKLVLDRLPHMKATFAFAHTFINRLLLEKPDFEKTPRMGIALLRLHSWYMKLNVPDDQLPLFITDDLEKDFNQLIDYIAERIDVEALLQFYEVIEEIDGVFGLTILHLQKRPNPPHSISSKADFNFSSFQNTLPREIWIRADFIEKVALPPAKDGHNKKRKSTKGSSYSP